MNQDVMHIFQCYGCRKQFPNIHQHIHHKIPRTLGGKDTPDNLLNLCPQCHDLLHNVAYKMMNKKYTMTTLLDMVKLTYDGDQGSVNRCMELASLVRDEMLKNKESGKSTTEFVEQTITIRSKHKQLLTEWAKSTNTSLESLTRRILLKAISDRSNITIDFKREEDEIKAYKRNGNK